MVCIFFSLFRYTAFDTSLLLDVISIWLSIFNRTDRTDLRFADVLKLEGLGWF